MVGDDRQWHDYPERGSDRPAILFVFLMMNCHAYPVFILQTLTTDGQAENIAQWQYFESK